MRAEVDPTTGELIAHFEPIEAAIFTDTIRFVAALVDGAKLVDDAPELAGDPALARLLPAGYGDDEAAQEFSDVTRAGIIDQKLDDSALVLAAFDSAGAWPDPHPDDATTVRIDHDQVVSWLRATTDLRLVLDARIRQNSSELAAPLDDDERRHFENVFDWLGFVQETLLITHETQPSRR